MAVAKNDKFRSAGTIVDDALLQTATEVRGNLPKPDLLKRVANRTRQKMRPRDPLDLDFEIIADSFFYFNS